jgi:hypothetical protein
MKRKTDRRIIRLLINVNKFTLNTWLQIRNCQFNNWQILAKQVNLFRNKIQQWGKICKHDINKKQTTVIQCAKYTFHKWWYFLYHVTKIISPLSKKFFLRDERKRAEKMWNMNEE